MAIEPACKPSGHVAWSRIANIGDYGGDLNKTDSTAEAEEPYAAQWLRDIRAARGSAYTTKSGTLVDAENTALARHFAAVWSRGPEKLRANSTPSRADERLEYWADVLGVDVSIDDQRYDIRNRCAAVWLASAGPTSANIEAVCQRTLGSSFVQAHLFTGSDLDTPPASTFWPGINPGSASDSLGGGAWNSSRCYLWVECQRNPSDELSKIADLMFREMPAALDSLLPAHATFSVSLGYGFILGTSLLGYDALTGA